MPSGSPNRRQPVAGPASVQVAPVAGSVPLRQLTSAAATARVPRNPLCEPSKACARVWAWSSAGGWELLSCLDSSALRGLSLGSPKGAFVAGLSVTGSGGWAVVNRGQGRWLREANHGERGESVVTKGIIRRNVEAPGNRAGHGLAAPGVPGAAATGLTGAKKYCTGHWAVCIYAGMIATYMGRGEFIAVQKKYCAPGRRRRAAGRRWDRRPLRCAPSWNRLVGRSKEDNILILGSKRRDRWGVTGADGGWEPRVATSGSGLQRMMGLGT